LTGDYRAIRGNTLSEDQFFILKSHTNCCGREDGPHEPCPGLWFCCLET